MTLPEHFETYTRSILGDEEYLLLKKALADPSSVSIRVNIEKTDRTPRLSRPVPWASGAYYLNERPSFTFDPLFHSGSYYVQEASSMFLEQALLTCVDSPVTVLDLCAAPGGKSTLIRSLLPEGSLLIANEPIRQRGQVLAENLTKWGHPDVVVTNNYPSDFNSLKEMFDLIIVDAPCSGEGMFRKDKQAVSEWSVENVEHCALRQREIVECVWNCLRPGGYIVYSTCTYNLRENEENVDWMAGELGAEVVNIPTKPEWNIMGSLDGNSHAVYRFLPGRTEGEGFFLALLRKDGEMSGDSKKKKRSRGVQVVGLPKECRQWIEKADEFAMFSSENGICAVRKTMADAIARIATHLKVVTAGIPLAEEKGAKWTPLHGLAMSNYLSTTAFCRVELSRADAIAYLRKETFVLGGEIPRGFVVVTYKNLPLGFVKNLGNRVNNLYPNEWRIRSGYSPDNILDIL